MRTVLITRANKGIGFAAATEILRQKEGEPHTIVSPCVERAMPVEIAEAIYFAVGSKNMIDSVLLSDGGRSLH